MKRNAHTHRFIISLSIAALAALASCDALWGTSVDVSGGSPYDSYYGWDGEWLPTLAGAPLISPYYYGGSAFPMGDWQPVYRPGTGPWGNPAWGGGAPSVVIPNRPSGNVRPGETTPTPSQPATPPASQPTTQPLYPSNPLNGSNPGIQLPPAGTGYRTPGRH